MGVRKLEPVPDLARALGQAILDGNETLPSTRVEPPHDTLDPADCLSLVRRSAAAEQAVKKILSQAVSAARAAGHSWAAIGHELGLSRQAVQQRFGSPETEDWPTTPELRWLGPVTAFDELHELELAGRRGWRIVGAGMLRHRMMRTDTQWEHRRVVWTRPVHHYEADGWQVGCRAFPWLYLVRDLGKPPESAASDTPR